MTDSLVKKCVRYIVQKDINVEGKLNEDLMEMVEEEKPLFAVVYEAGEYSYYRYELIGLYDNFNKAILGLFNGCIINPKRLKNSGASSISDYYVVQYSRNRIVDCNAKYYHFTYVNKLSDVIKLIKLSKDYTPPYTNINCLDTYLSADNNYYNPRISSMDELIDTKFNYEFPQLKTYNETCDI